MRLEFHIPRPPSVNGMFPGKQRRFKSGRYKAWEIEAGHILKPQLYSWNDLGLIPFKGAVSVSLTVNRGRADLANLEKGVGDLMTTHRVYGDDKQIERLLMIHDPKCEDLMFVTIESL